LPLLAHERKAQNVSNETEKTPNGDFRTKSPAEFRLLVREPERIRRKTRIERQAGEDAQDRQDMKLADPTRYDAGRQTGKPAIRSIGPIA
jgi:hypothetical protein